MLKFLVIVLIIVFNVANIGCVSNRSHLNTTWEFPQKPAKREVNSIPLRKGIAFTPEIDGVFLDVHSLENLLFNIDELDIYIKKQKFLIDTIRKHK